LRKDGIAGFTTNRIADVAGVGIGSLYQYFRDKDAILEIIVQRHLDELGAVLKRGTGGTASGRPLLDGLIDGAVAAHARDPALHRAISAIPDFPARFQRISAAKQKLEADIDAALQQILGTLAPRADAVRLQAAALIVYTLVEGAVHRAIAEQRFENDIAQLTAELKKAIGLYVVSLAD